jgi:hypothetical protein
MNPIINQSKRLEIIILRKRLVNIFGELSRGVLFCDLVLQANDMRAMDQLLEAFNEFRNGVETAELIKEINQIGE